MNDEKINGSMTAQQYRDWGRNYFLPYKDILDRRLSDRKIDKKKYERLYKSLDNWYRWWWKNV